MPKPTSPTASTLEPRARNVFAFHLPEPLAAWFQNLPQTMELTTGEPRTLAASFAPTTVLARMRAMAELVTDCGDHRLWPFQITTTRNLENTLAQNEPRAPSTRT